jgi:hypothetical protein
MVGECGLKRVRADKLSPGDLLADGPPMRVVAVRALEKLWGIPPAYHVWQELSPKIQGKIIESRRSVEIEIVRIDDGPCRGQTWSMVRPASWIFEVWGDDEPDNDRAVFSRM